MSAAVHDYIFGEGSHKKAQDYIFSEGSHKKAQSAIDDDSEMKNNSRGRGVKVKDPNSTRS